MIVVILFQSITQSFYSFMNAKFKLQVECKSE